MSWKFYTPSVIPSVGIALPANPIDGQEFTLVDSLSAPTYAWLLRYVAAKASNKWVFIGGSPIETEITTDQATTSTAYTALATAGPSIAIPVAGDYLVGIGFTGRDLVGGHSAQMSYDIGGTGAVDADQVVAPNVVNFGISVSRVMKKTGLTAVTLTAKYKTDTSGNGTFSRRWMSLTPIAIGG